MPKRKKTPVRLLNSEENWSFVAPTVNTVEDLEETPSKTPKLKIKKISTTILRCNFKNEKYFLGQFYFGSTKNVFPENWSKCKIQSSEDTLKLNFNDDSYSVVQLTDNVKVILDFLSVKIFSYDFDVDIDNEKVDILLYLQLPFKKFTAKVGEVLKRVMNFFFNTEIKDITEKKAIVQSENLEDFYKEISSFQHEKWTSSDKSVQHEALLPKLRPYQESAVRWMIEKEQPPEKSETPHPMFLPITLKSGEIIYYNIYTGYIDTVEPLVTAFQTGGILADEMGLGKTVEVLACILNNPRPDYEKFDEDLDQTETDLNESNLSQVSLKLDNLDRTDLNETQETNFVDSGEASEQNSEDVCKTMDESSIENTVKDLTIPKIETQEKYIKPKVKRLKQKNPKPKVDDKPKPKKSAAKLAAQLWYENKLAEMKIKVKKKPSNEKEVQCICGDFNRNGIVYCVDCKKMQHSECMGYKGNKNEYCCPQCWINKPLIKSKATLIVSPISICRQWSLEIQHHIRKNGLRVLVYKGIHRAGVMYPTQLANYDLVITTYNILQSELKFSNEEQCDKSFRYAKRYNSPNTPLLNIEWWRLCLDEAQTVDCPTSQVSTMAHQLNAVHRWAVTGTPIQKNITDLYGLIDYLKISPYNDLEAWKYVLYYPYLSGEKQPMTQFLSKIMWRTAKSDVIEQIGIPPQTIQEHWYEFSAVEKYFYKREHNLCANEFINKLRIFDTLDITLKSIDKQTLGKIIAPLLSLRQACIHPQAVRGKYLSRCKVNSMEGLLEALIKKNVQECEESLRAVMASLNGMAGILLLKENNLEAVDTYRSALQFISQYDKNEFIKIDKLQRIHTLYNLNEILHDPSYAEKPPPTLRDDKLEEECDQIEKQYMEKYITETKSAFIDAEEATKNVKKLKNEFQLSEGEWMCELNDWLITRNFDGELVKKIQNTMIDDNYKIKYEDIQSARSVMYLLTTWIDKSNNQLDKVRKQFEQFKSQLNRTDDNYHINEKIVNDAMECHLRPAKTKNKTKKNWCLCCQVDSTLKKYECMIFQMKVKMFKENESNKGTWHPSFEEKLLKAIYAFGKLKGADPELLQDGEIHLNLCEALRKEFKELRRLYTFYDQQVSAQDELNICKIRFRLRNSEEPVKKIEKKISILKNLDYELDNKYEFINVLSEMELDYNFSELYHEKTGAEEKLKKAIGTHSYLETLKNQQYSGQDPDPCPICGTKLEESWSLLQCGHCYCLDCIGKLLERFSILKYVTCSICRKKQLVDDVSYIKVKGTNDRADDFEIEGSYSTKVQAIIKNVMLLRKDDEKVKILIFSTWQAVLKALSEAFSKNNISFEHLTNYNLQEKLENFKDEKKLITVCLIPISLGAKGLNLIEATHVFLVEPLMNPGEELQAIGRVHRIGQTKPTFVHRFLIKNTIEENIHSAVSANVQKWDKNKLTLQQLKDLFVENCDLLLEDTEETEPSN